MHVLDLFGEESQPLNEGSVKNRDIERQDYENMSGREFLAAYKMGKAEWALKNPDIVPKKSKPKTTNEAKPVAHSIEHAVWSKKSPDEQKFLKQLHPDLKIKNVPPAPRPERVKKTPIDYAAIARKAENVWGNIFPDGDPVDWMYPYLKRMGIPAEKQYKVLDRAIRLHVDKKGYDHWLESSWDQVADDNMMPGTVTRENNPWRVSEGVTENSGDTRAKLAKIIAREMKTAKSSELTKTQRKHAFAVLTRAKEAKRMLDAGADESTAWAHFQGTKQEMAEGKWFRTTYGWAGGEKPGGGKYVHPEVAAERRREKAKKKREQERQAKSGTGAKPTTSTHCPGCYSTDIKTYSDGEKECHQCGKTWHVFGNRIFIDHQGEWEEKISKVWPRSQIEYSGEDMYAARLTNGYLVGAFKIDQGGWIEKPRKGVAEGSKTPWKDLDKPFDRDVKKMKNQGSANPLYKKKVGEQGVAEGSAYQHHVVSKLDGNVLASYKTREEAQKNAHGNPVVSGSLETIGDRQYTREQGVAEGYWQDAIQDVEAARKARKGKPFEKNPLSHDEQGVYIGDKDLAGNPVPKPNEKDVAEAKPGLYANVQAKRRRIKQGSGERMRKPGTKGAPTAQAWRDAAKTAKKESMEENMKLVEYLTRPGESFDAILGLNVFADLVGDVQDMDEMFGESREWRRIRKKYTKIAKYYIDLVNQISATGRKLTKEESDAIEIWWYDGNDMYDDEEMSGLAETYDGQLKLVERLIGSGQSGVTEDLMNELSRDTLKSYFGKRMASATSMDKRKNFKKATKIIKTNLPLAMKKLKDPAYGKATPKLVDEAALPEELFKTTSEINNPTDAVKMDIPLLIRIMEYAREDAKTDLELHDVAERLISLGKAGNTLSMRDYDKIVGTDAKAMINNKL